MFVVSSCLILALIRCTCIFGFHQSLGINQVKRFWFIPKYKIPKVILFGDNKDFNSDLNRNSNSNDNIDNFNNESPSLESLFSNGVMFLDDDDDHECKAVDSKIDDKLLFHDSSTIPLNLDSRKRTTMQLALMPFENPLFVGCKEFLYLYEKRYRKLLDDIENIAVIKGSDIQIGRCYINELGKIGRIGSLCVVVEKKRLNNGKGFLVIQSISRFKIIRLVKRTPYLLAEIELDYEDDQVSGTEDLNEKLCKDIYTLLKIYMRINHIQSTNNESDEKEFNTLSPGIRDNKPDANVKNIDMIIQRHQSFSMHCANLLSTEADIMQQLLQSKSTNYRLHGLKRVLIEAVEELSTLLMDDGLVTEEILTSIKSKCNRDDDDDSDLMPPANYNGVTIESELDDIVLDGFFTDAEDDEDDSNDENEGNYDDKSEDTSDIWSESYGGDDVLQ